MDERHAISGNIGRIFGMNESDFSPCEVSRELGILDDKEVGGGRH